MKIGDRIRKYRNLQGLSQTELADMIKVSKQTLYKYENNIITNVPSDKIEAIASIMNISPAQLMGWEDSADTNNTPVQNDLLSNTISQLNEHNVNKVIKYAQNLLAIQQMEDEPVLMAAHHDNPTEEQQLKINKDLDILKRPTL